SCSGPSCRSRSWCSSPSSATTRWCCGAWCTSAWAALGWAAWGRAGWGRAPGGDAPVSPRPRPGRCHELRRPGRAVPAGAAAGPRARRDAAPARPPLVGEHRGDRARAGRSHDRRRLADDRGGSVPLRGGGSAGDPDRSGPGGGSRLAGRRRRAAALPLAAADPEGGGMTAATTAPAAVRQLLGTSRPLSWINTAYPFAAAYLLAGGGVDVTLVVGTVFFLIPYNLLM